MNLRISGDQIFGKFTNICPHAKKKKTGLEFPEFRESAKTCGQTRKKIRPVTSLNSGASVALVISKF